MCRSPRPSAVWRRLFGAALCVARRWSRLDFETYIVLDGSPCSEASDSGHPDSIPRRWRPIGGGLVSSLAHPGGNVTGLSLQFTDLTGKRLELLREVLPGLQRLAVLANIGSRGAVLEMDEVHITARAVGVQVLPFEIRRAEDITPAFEALRGRAEVHSFFDYEAIALASRLTGISRG